MRHRGLSVEDAAAEALETGIPAAAVDAAVEEIRKEARKNELLKVPRGVEALEYQLLLGEAKRTHWYTGPTEHDRQWQALLEVMSQNGLEDEAVRSIDQASTKIVAHLPDPGVHGLFKKGLVVGFVQSGKTANYSAVLAKASDAGYRLFIVLAGIHNGLRAQTQRRLEHDVVDPHDEFWVKLTNESKDFGAVADGPGLLSARELRNLAVVKKNATRLQRLHDWLAAIPAPVRERCPAIIIDDEADQATPNTKAAQDELSVINRQIREIRKLLPTGGYIGYTATPFANVLLNAADEEELYPSDFILDLPRPEGYFGAQEIFGRLALDDADDPFDGYDMVRSVPADEAASLRAPGNRVARDAFDPDLPPSLDQALKWFVLSTAARAARGQAGQHASMLVHVTQYVQVQGRIAARVANLLDDLRERWGPALRDELRAIWESEHPRVPSSALGLEALAYSALEPHIGDVLASARVVIDNGSSEDRVDYTATEIGPDGAERPVPQKIIAVGGNTLSRGLTLEGLAVSYFTRSVKTYDALLQMGRWFGFRRGYDDLPRVWVSDTTRSDFRFLATVEEEIRSDMRRYEVEGVTPQQLGLRIRTHPSLAVTAANKMANAVNLNVSYGGARMQTFRFDHKNAAILRSNIEAGRGLISSARQSGSYPKHVEKGRWVLEGVRKELIAKFLAEYTFHPDHRQLDSEAMCTYLSERDDETASLWNVAVIGSSTRPHRDGGRTIDLGEMDLGLGPMVPMVNRARLKVPEDKADIKSLMSRRDRFVDLSVTTAEWSSATDESELQELREAHSGGRGLLLLYPISKDSVPMGAARLNASRLNLEADEHILGVGLVFPSAVTKDGKETVYVGLTPGVLGTAEVDDEEAELLAKDDEGDANISGAEFLQRAGG